MSPLIIIITAFIGVSALVGGVAVMLRGSRNEEVEQRLDFITTGRSKGKSGELDEGVLSHPLDDGPGTIEKYILKIFNLRLLLEQANAPLTTSKFILVSLILAGLGAVIPLITKWPIALVPVTAAALGILPFMWISFRRKRRMKKFAAQLPEALELISRALRAGHSLGSGLSMVGAEMNDPIASEFSRVFDEQNLGIPLEDALGQMIHRVPNLDLKFFSTAVILQRQTGGDLAEILDKIGHLVRERFKIWGQIQALTGEGRLSGIVLLALPPVLFIAVYKLNPEYVTPLFTDPMGKQMLAGAAVMQILGALVIRKIINIKV